MRSAFGHEEHMGEAPLAAPHFAVGLAGHLDETVIGLDAGDADFAGE